MYVFQALNGWKNKRGETFDIVILDPPTSSSVGKKKKRWSIKQHDMERVGAVALAACLVKSGGLLWTTTNCAGLSPLKFAKSCRHAGFDNASVVGVLAVESIDHSCLCDLQ
jgi:23S rRNA G2069 N7-methylase RlmK/C1962 C5-methylase RlmI